MGYGPVHATDQQWPLFKAAHGTGYQGRIRENAGALGSKLSGIGTKTAAGKLPGSCLALTCPLITKYFP